MSEPGSKDDEIRVDLPKEEGQTSPDSAQEQILVDDWDVAGDASPCAVYGEGPSAMGRVTTPLGDLRFANLFGGKVAMMRKLGQRSATEMREGAVPYLNEFLFELADMLMPRIVRGMGNWALENVVLKKLKKSLSATYMEALRAYAEGSGHDIDQVIAAQLAWDGWAMMAHAPSRRIKRATGRARRHAPLLGSASVILPNPGRGPLHLRWMDNAAIDRWDRKTSVAFFHPDRGLGYVLVSSIGFVTGLPAGMNAAGLSVTVEPGVANELNWGGAAVGQAIHDILSQAHTIEETAVLLRESPPLAPWRYVVCEGDTGRAAVFEVGARVERWKGAGRPPFSVAGADALVPGRNLARLSRWYELRRRALGQVIDGWSGGGDDAVYAALKAMTPTVLGGSVAPGHPLSGASNVGAVVFEPAERRLWVAAGRAPISRRWFVPLSLRAADSKGRGGLDSRVRPLKAGDEWESTESGRAIEHLRHAYQLELAGEPAQRILITLEHALALDPGEASYHILAGLMALRVGRGRRATGAFQKAIDLLDESTRRAEVGVYLGWALDLQKRRLPAKKLYRRIAKEPDVEPAVRRWARRGRRRRFRRRDARKLEIDFVLATVFRR